MNLLVSPASVSKYGAGGLTRPTTTVWTAESAAAAAKTSSAAAAAAPEATTAAGTKSATRSTRAPRPSLAKARAGRSPFVRTAWAAESVRSFKAQIRPRVRLCSRYRARA